MKITIIYDNTLHRNDLQSDWGFSALIETISSKILFDTGGRGSILISNMDKLGIDPNEINDVFISHCHFDHTGGLSDFLDRNSKIRLWLPNSFRGVKNVEEIHMIDKPRELFSGAYTTGELEDIEQFLCIETSKGIVIVAGCSHPKMTGILEAASQFGRVYGIVGGLHGTWPECLKDMDMICATHCTQHKQEIKFMYPDEYIEGGAGRVIEIED